MKKQIKPEEQKSSKQLLRDNAEGKLVRSSGTPSEMKVGTPEEVIHELQVHQIELEMQNEELRKAQLALEESRQRYAELYDFAPVGYFTFTPEALIKEVNLTGSILLGVARQQLINRRFRWFIASADFNLWDQHFLRVLKQGEKQTCDLMLKQQDGSTFCAGLESIRIEVSREVFEVHTAVTDITERKRAEETLRESEERYRDLVENSQDLICTHDLDGNLLSVNEVPVRALGYSRESLMNTNMRDFLAPEKRDKFGTYLREIQEKGRASGILRIQTASGETHYWEYNNTLRTEGVAVPIVRGIAHDVTERRKAEEALKESNDRFLSLAANIPGYIAYVNAKTLQYEFVNDAFEKSFGIPQEKIIGSHIKDIIGETNYQFALKYIDEVRLGKSISYQNTFDLISGKRWIQVNYAPVIDASGHVVSIVVLSYDITERRRTEEALKQSEAQYRLLAENMTDTVWLMDMNLRTTYISPSVTKLRGYTLDELQQLPLDQNLTPASFQLAMEVFSAEMPKLMADPTYSLEHTLELEFYRKDGSTFWAENKFSIIRDENGKPMSILGEGRDITDRKGAEEKLKESEKGYRELYDFLPTPVYEMDFEANITSANRAVYETFRGTEEDLKKGFKAWQLLSPEETERSIKNIQRLLKGEKLKGAEYTLTRLDGSVFPAIVISSVIYSNDQPVGLRGVVIDITERKQAEEKLRESEELFRSYLEQAPDGVYLSDPAGNFLYGNRKCEEIIGYRREELVGKNFLELNLLPEKSLNKAAQLLQANIEGKPTGPDEIELNSKEGRLIPVEINTSVVQRMGQSIVLSFVRDITERKRAEEMLRMSKDYLDNIINATGYPIFVKDDSFRFTLVNNALCVMLGIERENIIGKTLGESLPEDQMEHFLKVDKIVLDSGLENQCEELLTGSGGKILNIVTKKTRFVDEQGNNFLVGVIYDITERKQDQEKLSQTLENLRKALGGIIQVVAATVETRDPYTAGHQRRTADLSRAIAVEMGLTEDQQEGLLMAGIIHDLGKIAIPAEILSKPSQLSEIEYKLIKEHPQVGFEILKNIDFPWPIAEIVLKHHERMNGSGYPQGLKGEEICQEAKILMVADVVEAMASYRPYRPALGVDAALEEIEKNKGILYDSRVAEVCLKLFREKGFGFE